MNELTEKKIKEIFSYGSLMPADTHNELKRLAIIGLKCGDLVAKYENAQELIAQVKMILQDTEDCPFWIGNILYPIVAIIDPEWDKEQQEKTDA